MTTYQPITTCLSTAGVCKHKLNNGKKNWRTEIDKLHDYNLFFPPDSAAQVNPRPRRTARTVGSGGRQTECMVRALSCVTWRPTACTLSGSEAAGTPCSAPTAPRSPSTHHLRPVSLRGVVRLFHYVEKMFFCKGFILFSQWGLCSLSVLWVLSWMLEKKKGMGWRRCWGNLNILKKLRLSSWILKNVATLTVIIICFKAQSRQAASCCWSQVHNILIMSGIKLLSIEEPAPVLGPLLAKATAELLCPKHFSEYLSV